MAKSKKRGGPPAYLVQKVEEALPTTYIKFFAQVNASSVR